MFRKPLEIACYGLFNSSSWHISPEEGNKFEENGARNLDGTTKFLNREFLVFTAYLVYAGETRVLLDVKATVAPFQDLGRAQVRV